MKTINIIPSDYEGSPREALGYAAGTDVIVERTANGYNWRQAAEQAMAEAGLTEAHIICMWAGGFSGRMEIESADTAEVDEQPSTYATEKVADYANASEHKPSPAEDVYDNIYNEGGDGYNPHRGWRVDA